MVAGLPVSAVVYLLACRSMDVAADRRRSEEADLGLDGSNDAGPLVSDSG